MVEEQFFRMVVEFGCSYSLSPVDGGREPGVLSSPPSGKMAAPSVVCPRGEVVSLAHRCGFGSGQTRGRGHRCTTAYHVSGPARRNKHIMIDLGTGNNNKINWAMEDKQEMIDIIETVYRGARKGRGLVVSPKDYSTKYRY
uniref:Thioredoxin like 4A n=1 Tax=Equus caballus TaxID=9796 RepID=A0A9L0RJY1_HORSE